MDTPHGFWGPFVAVKPVIALIAVALALPSAASTQVTVNLPQAAAGSFSELTVRVPNERANTSTVKVDLRLPDGVYYLW